MSGGGAVTETIYAFGQELKFVSTDTSSIFPEAATKLPPVVISALYRRKAFYP